MFNITFLTLTCTNFLPITNIYGLFLLGSYYGLLNTLPLRLSHILFLRTFLLSDQENENTILKKNKTNYAIVASLSGLVFSQIFIILSIYKYSIYAFLVKPHTFSILILPYLVWCWSRIKEYNINEFINRPLLKSYYPYLAFIDSFCLEIFNSITFPSPVFIRLMYLFFFRYSNAFSFILGSIVGYFMGTVIFYILNLLILSRLKKDTPIIYTLLKRGINNIFAPLLFASFLIYLGRSSLPFISNNSLREIYKKNWPEKAFPTDLWKRPLRSMVDYKVNRRDRAFNKNKFSQNYFHVLISDGQVRLSHNFPKSIAIYNKQIFDQLGVEGLTIKNPQNIWIDWISQRVLNQKRLNQFILTKYRKNENRVFDMQRRIFRNINNAKNISTIDYIDPSGTWKEVSIIEDPRLQQSIEYQKPFTDNLSLQPGTILNNTKKYKLFLDKYKNNSLKKWIYQGLDYKKFDIISPWEKIEGSDINILLNKLQIIYPNELLPEKVHFNWEYIINVYGPSLIQNKTFDKSFDKFNNFFHSTNKEKKEIIQSFLKQLNSRHNDNNYDKYHRYLGILSIYKPISLWKSNLRNILLKNSILFKNSVDPISVLLRSLRNSIYTLRRKGILSNLLQNSLHVPFFLRSKDNIKTLNYKSEIVKHKTLNKTYSSYQIDDKLLASIIAKRFNFPLYHVFRNRLLLGQVYIRKSLKFPIFIVIKSIMRFITFQTSEWEKDWQDLSKEVYIVCTYDGQKLFVFSGEGKERNLISNNFNSLEVGMQIKILYPFHVRPWRLKNKSLYGISQDESFNKNDLEEPVYLTTWGAETEIPFGKIKRKPAFWKPIYKGLRLLLHYNCNKYIYSLLNTITKTVIAINGESKWINNYLYNNLLLLIEPNIQNKEQKLLNQKSTILDIQNINKESQKFDNTFLNNYDPVNISKIDINQKHSLKDITRIKDTEKLQQKFLDIEQKKKLLLQNVKIQQDKNSTFRFFTLENHNIDLYQLKIKYACYAMQKQISFLIRRFLILGKLWVLNTIKQFIFFLNKFVLFLQTKIFVLDSIVNNLVNVIIQQIFLLKNKTVFKIKVQNKENLTNYFKGKNKYTFSQAYFLNQIIKEQSFWINKFITTLSCNIKVKKNVMFNLQTRGLLDVNDPQKIQKYHWDTWLSKEYLYKPSIKIWQLMTPSIWSKEVQNSLNSPNIDTKVIFTNHDKNLENYNALSYHRPLFLDSRKKKKLSQFSSLYKSYLNDYYNDNLESKTTCKDFEIFQRLIKIQHPIKRYKVDENIASDNITIFKKKINQYKTFVKNNDTENILGSYNRRKFKSKKLREKLQNLNKQSYTNILSKEKYFFKNVMECVSSKIANEDKLTYDTISTFLKFVQKDSTKSYDQIQYNKDKNIFETILLTELLKEVRILNYLNSNLLASEKNEMYSNNLLPDRKTKLIINQNLYDIDYIKRYMWTKERFEDLACMDRFWISIANQSKFSTLRFRMYPNI